MNMKKLMNLSVVLIIISAMMLISCKKKNNGTEPGSGSGTGYAATVAGEYVGDITIPMSETLIDTVRNVSISLTRVNDTTVSFYVNQNLHIASANMDIPLRIEENTIITKVNEQYNFNVNANVTVQTIPIPVTVAGVVTGNSLSLTIDVSVIGLTLSAYYTGIKQE